MNNLLQRRRAQNRASQRAFRERKEKHVKLLEDQLQLLHDQHHSLLHSYSQQTMKVSELNEQIEKLTSELNFLRSSYNELSTPFAGGGSGVYLPENLADASSSNFLSSRTEAHGEQFLFSDQNVDSTPFSQMDWRL